jgi:hypothetical protein
MERLFDGFLFVVDFGAGALPDTRDVDPATTSMKYLRAFRIRPPPRQ